MAVDRNGTRESGAARRQATGGMTGVPARARQGEERMATMSIDYQTLKFDYRPRAQDTTVHPVIVVGAGWWASRPRSTSRSRA